MASPDELLAMLEEAASEAENAHQEQDQDEYEDVVEELMEELVDEVSLGLCFDTHRACKLDVFFLDETDKESQKKYAEKGRDVFGHIPMKKQLECVCPNCSRNLAASRFAPHLEKCMGMGRNSSRIASRRIAKSGKIKEEDNDDHVDSENEDNDSEWNFSSDRRDRKGKSQSKKFKKDKSSNNSPRKLKQLKGAKNGRDSPNVANASTDLPASYECLAPDDRKALLLQTCGVISEHTRKMCTRSQRCPQHSDEQRRDVRVFLMRTPTSMETETDVTVDIDSYEDGDAQALRDSLQWEASSNPSPADSTSTTNSTSSRKRKTGKTSKKKPNSKASSRAGTPSSLFEFS